jgi:tRNA-Thr(GGU) m(6)t(6)A37 methyltransferase TsaA
MTSKASGVFVVSSLLILSVTAYKFHTKKIEEIRKHFGDLRDAERKGRIKAEIKLRTQVKEEEKRVAASLAFYSNEKSSSDSDEKPMLLKCIGSVRSPFTKRMGTPRQGALAPHSRGYIQLNHSVAPMETLTGLDMYSHAWILFQFHANTDLQSISVKTKIRPPRGGGIKVGSMATRSPHRPNNIGLSLVKIDGIDTKKKRLHISALDLCNGTPVYGEFTVDCELFSIHFRLF